MNIINLCKDIINFEYSKDTNINKLLITKDINSINEYSNIKKICYISENLDDIIIDNFNLTNKEKIYDTDLYMHFYTVNDYIDNITFIIAGYTSRITNINRVNCYLYGKFIQSSIDQHTELDKKILDNAKINNYKIELNMYNQMHNIFRVLHKVDTEYCIKYRTDENFIDMDEYIQIMINTEKLIITNIYLTKTEYFISDHLFGCKTIIFKKMINNLKNILEFKIEVDNSLLDRTEKVFGVSYILTKYESYDLLNNVRDKYINSFYLYEVNRFKDYLISTVCIPSNIRIMSKYEKNKILFRKFRVYIKKQTAFSENNYVEKSDDDHLNNIRSRILFYTDINQLF